MNKSDKKGQITLFKSGSELCSISYVHCTYDESIANKWSMDPIQVPIGPVTRARAKRFK